MSYLRIAIAAEKSVDHDHFEVWRHTADLDAAAVGLVATRVGGDVRDSLFIDPGVEAGAEYWYWARSADKWGNASAFFALGSETAPVLNTEIATDVLLGRDSDGRGPVEEIAVTAPLAFTGAQALHIALSDPGLIGRASAGAGPATGLTVGEALTLLGFDNPIFDRASPGAIGGGTPAAGSFSELRASGAVRFGTHAVIGMETVTGYIEITDAAGIVRKLAVVS